MYVSDMTKMRRGTLIRLVVGVLLTGSLLAAACTPTSDDTLDTSTASLPETPSADVPATATGAPVLAGELTANCQPDKDSRGGLGQGIGVGETAVDFILEDINGVPVSLSGLLAEKPVVMIFGSFT